MDRTTGQMPDQPSADQPRGRWSWRSWLGVVAACVAGIVCLMLVVYFVAAATYDSNTSDRTLYVVITGLVVVPAVWLCWTHNRYWYSFAGGLVAPWAAIMLLLLFLDDDGAVQEDIPGRLKTLATATERPVYFLGQSYEGTDLTYVEDDGSFFAYGTCDDHEDGGCAPPAQVQNDLTFLPLATRGCRRVRDVRGVPAASFGGGLVVFTSDSMIHIFDDGIDGNVRSMAEALRPVSGPADVTKPLPPPTKALLGVIDQRCGAAPGDHGPQIED